jgi:hypothetical protein
VSRACIPGLPTPRRSAAPMRAPARWEPAILPPVALHPDPAPASVLPVPVNPGTAGLCLHPMTGHPQPSTSLVLPVTVDPHGLAPRRRRLHFRPGRRRRHPYGCRAGRQYHRAQGASGDEPRPSSPHGIPLCGSPATGRARSPSGQAPTGWARPRRCRAAPSGALCPSHIDGKMARR